MSGTQRHSLLGVLKVLAKYMPRPSGRKLPWARHLDVLGTKTGEKCGLLVSGNSFKSTIWDADLIGAEVTKGAVFEVDVFRKAGGTHCTPGYSAVNQAESVPQLMKNLLEKPFPLTHEVG